MFEVFLVNSVVVSLAVGVHYEFLYRLTTLLPKMRILHRSRIVLGVMGALVAHAVEVWIFAIAYFFMHHTDGWGAADWQLRWFTDGLRLLFLHCVQHRGIW